ncbi:DDE superfamily endonuclease-domain-containing protein [Mortierella sp. GBAus27b]|nr:DDE superfamily endonuclease-domain-containing protein [Mortierella sp. GBAus27b]
MTWNEYCIVIQVLRFIDSKQSQLLFRGSSRREQLAALTGVSYAVAQKAIEYYEDPNGFQSDPPPDGPVQGTKRGRKRQMIDDEQRKRLKEITHDLNITGATCSSAVIRNHLETRYHITTKTSTVLRQLKATGLCYNKRHVRNTKRDSPAIVEYRRKYVQERLSNLNEHAAPIRPEVFLDECYVRVDHSMGNRWMDPSDPGRAIDPNANAHRQENDGMIAVFGAFVVWTDQKCNAVRASFVQNNIINWSTKRGNDYQERGSHGHFNAVTFETIFMQLCNTLNELGHKNCIIHMDGAPFHFTSSDRVPSKRATNEAMIAWLKSQIHIPLPMETIEQSVNDYGDSSKDTYDDDDDNNDSNTNDGKGLQTDKTSLSLQKQTKAQLFARIQQITAGKEANFTTGDIAKERGHTILKTPPYHCDLQPIEKVCSMVKQNIKAQDLGSESFLSVSHKLGVEFSKVEPDTFLALWRDTIETNRMYSLQ